MEPAVYKIVPTAEDSRWFTVSITKGETCVYYNAFQGLIHECYAWVKAHQEGFLKLSYEKV